MQDDPEARLKVMQKRIEDMFQLLNLWQQYVLVIYAPEAELAMLCKGANDPDQEFDPVEMTFSSKVEKETIEERLATLFANEKDSSQAAEYKEEEGDAYMSVNEGETTDTSATTEVEEMKEERKPDVMSALKQEIHPEEKIEEMENEGIQSSDEEAASTEAAKGKPLNSFNEERMFDNYKAKDASAHGFNFGEEHMDNYESNLKAKLDERQAKKGMRAEVESGPIDYIAEAADTPGTDLSSLNLYGDQEFQTEQESQKQITKKREMMRELIDAMERLDPDNEL